jgi:ribosomal protein L11 methyltransferase
MASMTTDWVDVEIRSTLDAGEVLGLLGDPLVQGAWQDDRAIHLYWSGPTWSSAHLAHLRWVLRELTGNRLPEPDIVVHALPDQDWNRQWAESVKPLRIGKRLVIRPTWEKVDGRSGQIEIILDPKRAFGTGHHATTRMLLEWLEEVIHGGESVLDVGTGSGILAMAAVRLGAARAVGMDHDADAVECAREYAAVNGFGPELALQCGTLTEERLYDCVLANLDRQTLLQLAAPLAASTGRILLTSGVLTDQRQAIADAFARLDLYEKRVREQDGWLAIEFARIESCEGAG